MSFKTLLREGYRLFKENKYQEAMRKFKEALDRIQDKSQQIEEQNNAQYWLGRCYLEQAIKTQNETEAKPLFEQAITHHKEQLALAKKLKDEKTSIEEQNNAQFWLGRCYLEQAIKTQNETEAKPLFEQAITHHKEQLALAKKLKDEKTSIEEQNNAQSCLGRCYLEQAIKTSDTQIAEKLFKEAIKHNKERLKLAKQLTNTQKSIEQQVYVQGWLGRCYLEQAIKTSDTQTAKSLFDKAIKHNQERLELAKQLTNKQKSIEEQTYIQGWLGLCYLEQAIKTSNTQTAEKLFKEAIEHNKERLKLAKQLTDKQKSIEQQVSVQGWLGRCYFEKALIVKDNKEEDFKKYLEKKALVIKQKLFSDLEKPNTICTILAILYTPNHELRNTALAHYTTANVAELLFGLNKKKKEERTDENERDKSNMRMNSATYMNDPYEGKSFLEFLGKPEESLENITEFPEYNAFFSCFSSRVNDLNQFRLYGKEDGVEASGCCLVFNKNGDWLKGSDITKSFSSIKEQEETSISMLSEKKYSLYQIAYLAYLDEYIDTAKYKDEMREDKDSKFAIYLPKIGNNDEWHKLRMEKLKEALENLKEEINKENTKFNQQALEYIRYLFKDFAFKDEEEFRMLNFKKLGDGTKYCETTNSVFVEYGDISNMVDEVILGTNYEKTTKNRKVEVFRHKMIESGFTHVKVTQSSLPINANPPILTKN